MNELNDHLGEREKGEEDISAPFNFLQELFNNSGHSKRDSTSVRLSVLNTTLEEENTHIAKGNECCVEPQLVA